MPRDRATSSIDRLVALKGDFLRFVRARVRSDAEAEDLLQAAYLKATARADTIREDESTVAWFYRLLRNAVIDLHRERGRGDAAPLEEASEVPDPELHRAVCACVSELVPTLKPDWARLVRRVDLEGVGVPDAARDEGITPNNAAVRLHRARAALRDKVRTVCGACARHGCLDCSCHRRSP
jgi:RNA polymerase sigma factor (sigma-70 family)